MIATIYLIPFLVLLGMYRLTKMYKNLSPWWDCWSFAFLLAAGLLVLTDPIGVHSYYWPHLLFGIALLLRIVISIFKPKYEAYPIPSYRGSVLHR